MKRIKRQQTRPMHPKKKRMTNGLTGCNLLDAFVTIEYVKAAISSNIMP